MNTFVQKSNNISQQISQFQSKVRKSVQNRIKQKSQIKKKQEKQFKFLSYQEQIKMQQPILCQSIIKNQYSTELVSSQWENYKSNDFDIQERQSLKNAFRYICRLVFKEATNYYQVIQRQSFCENDISRKFNKDKKQIYKTNKPISKGNNKSFQNKYAYLFQQAEQISGQRYFKQFLSKLHFTQKTIVLKYMIWFLKTKYVRYINKSINENKGKRKQMKKSLYIRFKNQIMLPYLHKFLQQTQLQ